MHRFYIEKIINSENDQKMHDLKDILIDSINYIHSVSPETYEKIECDLYEISEGKKLSEEKATQWVNSMQPKAKWSINEIQTIINQYQSSLPIIPAYVIMNMLYSDFGDVLGEELTDKVIETYVKAAEDWYYDEDLTHIEDEKLYYYWKHIVN